MGPKLRKMMIVVLMFLLMLPLLSLSAQEDRKFRRDVRAQMEKDKLDRLKGWKRIVFWCSPPGKPESNKMFERICDRTNTNVQFLAESSRTKIRIAKDAFNLGFLSAADGMLQLQVDLSSVGCNGSACAINATLSATFPYEKAIDQTARSYPIDEENLNGPSESPAAVPRPIDALMWGPRSLIASGYPGEELASSVTNGLDALLKEFFTDHLKANRE
jgi:hypothetical protein